MNPITDVADFVVIFDLGGVLIDWDPRYLYRKLFAGNDAAMESFLANVCSPAWNLQQDAGRSFYEACSSLKAIHPEKADLIDAWFGRFDEMLAGPISGTVDILGALRARAIPVYALSNWSTETFPFALRRFDFLKWFDGILLSGEVRLVKPDARIFRVLFETFGINPKRAVYIDDLQHNVEAAASFGMHAILFTNPAAVRDELVAIGLLTE